VLIAVNRNYTDYLSRLLSTGMFNDRVIYDQQGITALHLSVAHGHHECVKLLLTHADDPAHLIFAPDNEGKSSLFYAIDVGSVTLVKALLDALLHGIHWTNPPDDEGDRDRVTAEHADRLVEAANGNVVCNNGEWGACFFGANRRKNIFDDYALEFIRLSGHSPIRVLYEHAKVGCVSAIEWMLRLAFVDAYSIIAALEHAQNHEHVAAIECLRSPQVVLTAIAMLDDASEDTQRVVIKKFIRLGVRELSLFDMLLLRRRYDAEDQGQHEAMRLLGLMAKVGLPGLSVIENIAKRHDVFAVRQLILGGGITCATISALRDRGNEGVANLMAYLHLENTLGSAVLGRQEKINELAQWLNNGCEDILVEILQDCVNRRCWDSVAHCFSAGVPFGKLRLGDSRTDGTGSAADIEFEFYAAVLNHNINGAEAILHRHNQPMTHRMVMLALMMSMARHHNGLVLLLLHRQAVREHIMFSDTDAQRLLKHAIVQKNEYVAAALITAEGLVYSKKGHGCTFDVSHTALMAARQLMTIEPSLIVFSHRQWGECTLIHEASPMPD